MSWRVLTLVLSFSVAVHIATAATVAATYLFQNTLAASQGGAPALTAVDPLAASGFVTDTVFGDSRQVWEFSGSSTPANQAGLVYDNTVLAIPSSSYSVELVFQFFNSSGYRRILDVQNRLSDGGLYVDPSSKLNIFPAGSGPTTFTANAYHHVVVTNNGTQAIGYLDGVYQFTLNSNEMNINNGQNVINLFLDNTAGAGQSEYSSGRIALAQFYSGVLTSHEIADIYAADPVAAASTPEPASVATLGASLAALMLYRRRRA